MQRVLQSSFVTAVYTRTQETEYSLFLSDIPIEELLDGNPRDGHVLHIELLWIPKAGATPVEATATNISITSIIFSGDEVGVYGGAGFAVPSGRIGEGRMSLAVLDASLVLIDATSGFIDLLSPARLVGTVAADFDAARARRLRFAVAQEMTNRLGRTRVIRGQHELDGGAAADQEMVRQVLAQARLSMCGGNTN